MNVSCRCLYLSLSYAVCITGLCRNTVRLTTSGSWQTETLASLVAWHMSNTSVHTMQRWRLKGAVHVSRYCIKQHMSKLLHVTVHTFLSAAQMHWTAAVFVKHWTEIGTRQTTSELARLATKTKVDENDARRPDLASALQERPRWTRMMPGIQI